MALEKNIIIVSVVTDVIGLLSVVLGFAAESTKTRSSDLRIVSSGGCVHQTSPAFGLALGAAFLLQVSQVIISAFIGCCCCRQKDQQFASGQEGTNRKIAWIMFSISWVSFAISFFMFIGGAVIESSGANGQADVNCSIVKPGVFCTASTLALGTFSLSIGAYILLNYVDAGSRPAGIVMGQPQFPQFPQSIGIQQFQHGVLAGEPQKPVNHGQQYYPPLGMTPQGYGQNTKSLV